MRKRLQAVAMLGVALLVSAPLGGCLVVGYSTGGGWWVWPGSLAVTLVLLLVWLLTRR